MKDSVMYDKDGFTILQRKEHSSEKKKEKKSKKRKFKKGSVKSWVYRLMKKYAPRKTVKKFHDTRMENLVIYDKDDHPHVVRCKGSLEKTLVKKLKTKYPDAYILINGGDGFFSKVSIETYLIVSKITRIAVHYELTAMIDGSDEEERNIITPIDRVFDSINELVRFHMTERTRIDTISDMCCRDFWYDLFNNDYRIMVEYVDGSLAYYKHINDFFDAIGMSAI